MASWLAPSDFMDNSDRYYIGASSVPKVKQNRKRTSASAGLQDNFMVDFERKLKLTPLAKERLKTADKLLQDPHFVLILMKSLPESCIRKLATTCTTWQALAYTTLREKAGNNAFSLLWIDTQAATASQKREFDFRMFFHNSFLFGSCEALLPASRNTMPLLEVHQNETDLANYATNTTNTTSSGATCLTGSAISEKPQVGCNNGKVGFILTYASKNMEEELMTSGQNENKTFKSAAFGSSAILVLSSSIMATTPDGLNIVEAMPYTEPETKLITSIMFPQCSHILFECFSIPSCPILSGSTCLSCMTDSFDTAKQLKALVLFQYLNIIDGERSIMELLQSLRMTHGSTGFPMIAGIYDYIDASLSVTLQKNDTTNVDAVASGFLICGDDLCCVSVISVNLSNANDGLIDNHFEKIEEFYKTNDAFSTKYALLFFHYEITTTDNKNKFHFKYFIDTFRRRLPTVKIHGIGSLSGAHGIFVDSDSSSSHSFRNLNERMTRLTDTVDSISSDCMEMILLLITYQAD